MSTEVPSRKKKISAESTPAPGGDHRKRLTYFCFVKLHQAIHHRSLDAATGPLNHALDATLPNAWCVIMIQNADSRKVNIDAITVR